MGTASQRGRTECVPPRKPPLGVISDLSPHGHPCWASPPAEGRAPHARKGDLACTGGLPPLGHRPFAYSSLVMPYPGLRTALPHGRTECAPPRKPPFTWSPGLPR